VLTKVEDAPPAAGGGGGRRLLWLAAALVAVIALLAAAWLAGRSSAPAARPAPGSSGGPDERRLVLAVPGLQDRPQGDEQDEWTLIWSTAAPADGAPGTKTYGPHQAGPHPLRDQVNVSRCLQAVPLDERLSGGPQVSGGALSILSRKTRPVWIPVQGRHAVHDRRPTS